MMEGAPALGVAVDEWLGVTRASRSPRTADLYSSACRSLLSAIPAETPLPTLTLTSVTTWIASLYRGRRRNTVAEYASIARLFLRWSYRQGWLARDLAGLIDLPRREQVARWPLADEAVRALLGACRRPEDRAALLLLYGCGLRVSEVVGVRWADIDVVKQRLRVRGKGAKQRWAGLPPAVMAALGPLRGRQGPLLGVSTPHGLRYRLHRLEERAGLAGVTPHRLRHSFAHAVLEAGGDILLLRDMLGHENVATTQYYLRAIERERAADAVRRYSPAERLGA